MTFGNTEAELLLETNAIKAKQNIVFCVLILFSNSMVIITIYSSKLLPKLNKFHNWTSICVCSMISSTYMALDSAKALGVVDVGTSLNSLVYGFHLYSAPSIVTLTFMFISLDFCIYKSVGPLQSRYISRTHMSLWIPWAYGGLALAIVILASCLDVFSPETDVNRKSTDRELKPILLYRSVWPLMIGWVFLPMTLAFILITVAGIVYCRENVKAQRGHRSLEYSPVVLDTGVSLLVFTGVNLVFYNSLTSEIPCTAGEEVCPPGYKLDRGLELARWSVFFLMPLFCQLDKHFRQVTAILCGRLFFGLSC